MSTYKPKPPSSAELLRRSRYLHCIVFEHNRLKKTTRW